jgi:hypothetical protein
MTQSTDVWLRGLISAAISGGAGAASGAIGGMVIAPNELNMVHPLKLTEMMLGAFAITGTIAVMNYLKQSPLPAASVTTTVTQSASVTVVQQPAAPA